MNLDKATYDQQTQPMHSHINVGSGYDITIKELAEAVGRTVGYLGNFTFDLTKPDGTERKLMDSTRINDLGWHARINLTAGLQAAYQDFLANCVTHN